MLRRTKQSGERLIEEVLLTPREFRLLSLYVQGLPYKQIGAAMHLSMYTVDQYLKLMALRVGVSDRRQLFIWANQRPGALEMGKWVERGVHPPGCQCPAVYCTAIRVSQDPTALEKYRQERDAARAAEAAKPA